jgi:hypothetical protein
MHEPFDPEWVLADQELGELAVDDRLDRRERGSRPRRAHEPLVELRLDIWAESRLADAPQSTSVAPRGTRTAVVSMPVIRKRAVTLRRPRGIVNHR